MPRGADPHTYKVTLNDVQMVLGADLCIENGLHLEGKNWMGTLAKDANKPLITATEGIQVLSISEGGQAIPAPHAWFSLKNVAVYVNNITKAVVELDPKNRETYRARARLFLQQLRVLDAWIREQINTIPPKKGSWSPPMMPSTISAGSTGSTKRMIFSPLPL